MYVDLGALSQDVAEAYVPWLVSVWQYFRGETPPMDWIYPVAQALASGRTTPEDVFDLVAR